MDLGFDLDQLIHEESGSSEIDEISKNGCGNDDDDDHEPGGHVPDAAIFDFNDDEVLYGSSWPKTYRLVFLYNTIIPSTG